MNENITVNIKIARESANITYDELAIRTKIPKSTLQRYETGSTTKIPIEAIRKIADALNILPAYLMGWQSSPQTEADSFTSSIFSQQENDIVNKYRSLDERGKKTVLNTLEQEYSYIEKQPYFSNIKTVIKEAETLKAAMDAAVLKNSK